MIVNTLGLKQPGRLSENLYLYFWLHRPQLRVKLWFPFACLQINWFLVEIDLDSEYMKPPLFFESHWVDVHTVTDPCVAYAHPAGALIWITGCNLVCLSMNGKISQFTNIARIMNDALDSAHNILRENSLNVGDWTFHVEIPKGMVTKYIQYALCPEAEAKKLKYKKKKTKPIWQTKLTVTCLIISITYSVSWMETALACATSHLQSLRYLRGTPPRSE